jgi:phosphomethylpyrimidine synthase
MADIPARTELKVTTGPIRGSRKVHVGPLGVAMREIPSRARLRRAALARL